MGALRSWILSLAAVGVIGSAALSVTLSVKMKRVVSLACAFLASAVMLSPIGRLAGVSFDEHGFEINDDSVSSALEEKNAELRADIIARETEAYIVNKARGYGAEVTAEVSLTGEGVPYSCAISSDSGGAVRFVLSEAIESDLGIPRERQYWG